MNDFAEAMIEFANDQRELNKQYVYGRRGPKTFDCMGLMHAAARAADLDSTVFPNSWTVRNLTAWARKNGYLRLAKDGYPGERGDLGLWGPIDGGQPIKGAGHVFLVKRAPTAARPKGRAISAFNPAEDIINHGVFPKPGHLALYGFIVLPYPQPEVPPEIEDSAPPSDAVEPPDDEPDAPTVEELQAKIDAAKAALA